MQSGNDDAEEGTDLKPMIFRVLERYHSDYYLSAEAAGLIPARREVVYEVELDVSQRQVSRSRIHNRLSKVRTLRQSDRHPVSLLALLSSAPSFQRIVNLLHWHLQNRMVLTAEQTMKLPNGELVTALVAAERQKWQLASDTLAVKNLRKDEEEAAAGAALGVASVAVVQDSPEMQELKKAMKSSADLLRSLLAVAIQLRTKQDRAVEAQLKEEHSRAPGGETSDEEPRDRDSGSHKRPRVDSAGASSSSSSSSSSATVPSGLKVVKSDDGAAVRSDGEGSARVQRPLVANTSAQVATVEHLLDYVCTPTDKVAFDVCGRRFVAYKGPLTPREQGRFELGAMSRMLTVFAVGPGSTTSKLGPNDKGYAMGLASKLFTSPPAEPAVFDFDNKNGVPPPKLLDALTCASWQCGQPVIPASIGCRCAARHDWMAPMMESLTRSRQAKAGSEGALGVEVDTDDA